MKISKRSLIVGFTPLSFMIGGILLSGDAYSQEAERKASSNRVSSAQTTTATRASSSRGNSSKRSRTSTTTTSSTTQSAEYIKEDCATKYMLGLDRECYNENKDQSGGAYSDCSDKTMADYYDIMDMQLSAVVGANEFSAYKKKCDAYKGYALDKWLGAKNTVETSAVKGSSECVVANNRLKAAKKCYAAAIAHDGNFFEFTNLMTQTCGEQPDVASKFAKAGDLGLANIPKLLENYSTLQFTNKSENWRNAVEAVLAGYIYEARQACGEETYEMLELNEFTEDKRGNLLSTAKESFVKSATSNLGHRTSKNVIPSIIPNNAEKDKGEVGIHLKYYDDLGWIDERQYRKRRKKSIHDKKYLLDNGTNTHLKDVDNISNVYVIEGVKSINSARARLLNILDSGDIGTDGTQDDIDIAIITGLGGRVGSTDTGLYTVISNLSDGDTFVIKQQDNVCQVLVMDEDGNLSKLSSREIQLNRSLQSYVRGCAKVVE